MSVKPGRPNIGRNFRIISLRTCIIRFVPCSLFLYIILVVGGWDPKILPHSMGTPLCGCGANRRWAANHEMRRPNGGLAEFGRQPVMLNSGRQVSASHTWKFTTVSAGQCNQQMFPPFCWLTIREPRALKVSKFPIYENLKAALVGWLYGARI